MLGLDSSFISQDFHLVFSCLKRKNEEEEEDQERLPDSEYSLEKKDLQGKGQAGSVGEPPAQEEGSRGKTPEGLVGLDSGFSSQDFYNIFSCLKRKNEEEEDKVAVLESASK
ncbi:5'-Amp-Activated Protein Kinase Subunit Gamma-3 [Manis pentadactyla]|nr:5'-Amp-Activated Protein Kinase Subunit Gamma-3 [Manis pentadactyla]